MQAFFPLFNNNNLSITASSQSFVIPSNISGYSSLEINNESGQEIFIATGVNSATAVITSSYPVMAGHCKTITIPTGHNTVAYIGTSASGSVSFSIGGGI